MDMGIVDRLRGAAKLLESANTFAWGYMQEAANEIERLRAEIEEVNERRRDLIAMCEQLELERDEAREAGTYLWLHGSKRKLWMMRKWRWLEKTNT